MMQLVSLVAERFGFANSKLNIRNQGLKSQSIPELEGSIWVHCASLGEFEQGSVLIEALRIKYPKKKLVLTFFSASGYQKKKDYVQVDHVLYLPYDTPDRMTAMIDLLHPELVIFVKYEFWFVLLDILAIRHIPFVFVSAVFRPDQYLFRRIYRPLLARIFQASHIFVQNQSSQKLLVESGYLTSIVAGDTRIDRVMELRSQEFSWPSLERWIGNERCVIAGSTWSEGEAILGSLVSSFQEWKWIVATHEITKNHMAKLKKIFGDQVIFLSDLGGFDAAVPRDKQVLVIDRIGLLSLLYRYGDIAYIGGGMGAGIHNTLEPAVYGLPLIFGPKYQKFQEAVDFYERGAVRVINSTNDMKAALHYFDDRDRRQRIRKELDDYFTSHSGATELILKTIENLISSK